MENFLSNKSVILKNLSNPTTKIIFSNYPYQTESTNSEQKTTEQTLIPTIDLKTKQ